MPRMYAVFIDDAIYYGSLCHRRYGAASYLPDARHSAKVGYERMRQVPGFVGKKPRVRVVRVEVTELR